MNRIVIIFSLFFSFLYSLEIGIESFQKEIENDPSNIEARLVLARYHKKEGDYDKAIVYLDQVLNIDLNHKKANSMLEVLNKQKDEQIVAKLKTIKLKKPVKSKKSSKTLLKKAEKLYFKKEYLKSLSYYKKYFRKVSKDSNARFHYATALENLQKFEKSQKEYHKVIQNVDDLYELSSYRYARVLMAQRVDYKWEEARNVLTNLQQVLQDTELSKETDELLKYTRQSLSIVNQPMPKPKIHKDIVLTAEQKKILNQQILAGNSIEVQDVSSVKSMLNPLFASANDNMDVIATVFVRMVNEEVLQNREYGVKIGVSSVSLEAKKSTFKNGKKLDAQSLTATYDNGNDFFISLGVNSFDDDTKYSAKIYYQKIYYKHDITYGAGYQNGIFKNGSTCMVDNDINVISLSLYDSILLKNLKHTQLSLELNNFSDKNLNINSWVNYPLYTHIKDDFENTLSLSGSYEYNSKDDTCYGAADFFDGNYIQMKSKYALKNGYIEAKGSVGYSAKNNDVIYSYGFIVRVYTASSADIYIDCNHYQSGYSPDGADECYASVVYVW